MSQSELLERLVKSPNAMKIIEAAQSVFENEKAERKKFYDLLHENMKAEFINGEIVMHSPARLRHLIVSTKLTRLLDTFVHEKRRGLIGVEKLMVRLTRNDYEPDICFFKKERAVTFRPEQMLFPAPDFVVEILSESTEKIDRGIKFIDYAAHGIPEYWIIDPILKSVEKYLLQQGEYILQVKLAGEGLLYCTEIEGFTLDVAYLFSN